MAVTLDTDPSSLVPFPCNSPSKYFPTLRIHFGDPQPRISTMLTQKDTFRLCKTGHGLRRGTRKRAGSFQKIFFRSLGNLECKDV